MNKPLVDMLWFPDFGCGYYPVDESAQVYDQHYFAKYMGYARTERGKALNAARVALVRRFVGHESVLDFGIGCGSFIEAHGNARGYDIMPPAVAWLKMKGLYTDPWRERVDVLTAWDSLEHIRRPDRLIRQVNRLVFVSTPIYTSAAHARSSKHFRPDEHFWYWTGPGLIRLFDTHGFECLYTDRMEEEHGREDIGTFVFRRIGDIA